MTVQAQGLGVKGTASHSLTSCIRLHRSGTEVCGRGRVGTCISQGHKYLHQISSSNHSCTQVKSPLQDHRNSLLYKRGCQCACRGSERNGECFSHHHQSPGQGTASSGEEAKGEGASVFQEGLPSHQANWDILDGQNDQGIFCQSDGKAAFPYRQKGQCMLTNISNTCARLLCEMEYFPFAQLNCPTI